MHKNTYEVVLCGACMSGNIGGPALYISFAEELQKHLPQARFTVLSKYLQEDAPACKKLGWKICDMRTQKQLLQGLFIGFLASLLRMLHLPYKWLFRGDFAAYLTGDVLVDMSGISFTDHRPGTGILINSLWFIPALGTGIPIVKASQAMGPFKKTHIRLASLFFLKRIQLVIARGAKSEQYLKELLPSHNIYQLPDSAFSLIAADKEKVNNLLSQAGVPEDIPYCVFGPSHVISLYADSKENNKYVESMASVAQWILEESKMHIVLLPHESKNIIEDDHAVCKAIAKRLNYSDRVHIIPPITDPKLAKGLCARAAIAVGSRFHFLVATLSSGVPSLAIAWSHKYFEMMQTLGQEDMVISHEQTSVDSLLQQFKRLWDERDSRKKMIESLKPNVITAAKNNAAWVAELLTGTAAKRNHGTR